MDTYLVFSPEDRFHACICFGEAEAKEIIGHFDCPAGLRVHRITEGEAVRDVTADLIPDDDEADDAFGIPSPDSLRRWHEGRVL